MEKPKRSRKKVESNPRITAEQRRDWRTLPIMDWNVLTFTTYFVDMNNERFGVAKYFPMGNWRLEQAQIKRAIDAYGPELLRAAFDECFRDYRPTWEYPILTAGFCVSYRINGIIPRLIEERRRRAVADMAHAEKPDKSAVMAWL